MHSNDKIERKVQLKLEEIKLLFNTTIRQKRREDDEASRGNLKILHMRI